MLLGFRNRFEDLLHHSRNNTWVFTHLLPDLTLHRMGFSGSGLSISKYSTIETFDNAIDDWGCGILVHLNLGRSHIKDLIKIELEWFLIVFALSIANRDSFIVQQLVAVRCAHCLLLLVEGTKSYDNLDVGCAGNQFFSWHVIVFGMF